MQSAEILCEEMRHTRLVQVWLADVRRFGPLSEATTAWVEALPLEQLEALAAWLATNLLVRWCESWSPANVPAPRSPPS